MVDDSRLTSIEESIRKLEETNAKQATLAKIAMLAAGSGEWEYRACRDEYQANSLRRWDEINHILAQLVQRNLGKTIPAMKREVVQVDTFEPNLQQEKDTNRIVANKVFDEIFHNISIENRYGQSDESITSVTAESTKGNSATKMFDEKPKPAFIDEIEVTRVGNASTEENNINIADKSSFIRLWEIQDVDSVNAGLVFDERPAPEFVKENVIDVLNSRDSKGGILQGFHPLLAYHSTMGGLYNSGHFWKHGSGHIIDEVPLPLDFTFSCNFKLTFPIHDEKLMSSCSVNKVLPVLFDPGGVSWPLSTCHSPPLQLFDRSLTKHLLEEDDTISYEDAVTEWGDIEWAIAPLNIYQIFMGLSRHFPSWADLYHCLYKDQSLVDKACQPSFLKAGSLMVASVYDVLLDVLSGLIMKLLGQKVTITFVGIGRAAMDGDVKHMKQGKKVADIYSISRIIHRDQELLHDQELWSSTVITHLAMAMKMDDCFDKFSEIKVLFLMGDVPIRPCSHSIVENQPSMRENPNNGRILQLKVVVAENLLIGDDRVLVEAFRRIKMAKSVRPEDYYFVQFNIHFDSSEEGTDILVSAFHTSIHGTVVMWSISLFVKNWKRRIIVESGSICLFQLGWGDKDYVLAHAFCKLFKEGHLGRLHEDFPHNLWTHHKIETVEDGNSAMYMLRHGSCPYGSFHYHGERSLRDHKLVVLIKATIIESLLWDPGLWAIIVYILEDNDVFERVGKRIIWIITMVIIEYVSWIIPMVIIEYVSSGAVIMGCIQFRNFEISTSMRSWKL